MKLSQKELDTVEIDAAVFKVIRANQDKGNRKAGRKAIIAAIKHELPECTTEQIAESIQRLAR